MLRYENTEAATNQRDQGHRRGGVGRKEVGSIVVTGWRR